MSDDKLLHDFNWVKAKRECSVFCEMAHLEKAAQCSVEERRKNAEHDRRANIEFRKISQDHFSVCHRTTPSYGEEDYDWCVHFQREPEKILVEHTIQKKGVVKRHVLTLTLNNDGDCRYRVDGLGEYLRWQVLKEILDPLFWPHS